MIKNKFTYLSVFTLLLVLIACSSSDNEVGEKQDIDNEKPTITCVNDILVNIAATESGANVTYDTPVGTDNVSAITTQTAGLSSGGFFPVGTTTNTFRAADAGGNSATCSFDVTVTRDEPTGNLPFFIGNNPAPTGKQWAKLNDLSDEFDGSSFDEVKWKNTDPQRWVGRPPGIFKKNTVSVADGNLKLTSYKLDTPEVVNGNTFTHAGSNITSNTKAQVGQYFECKMKANKTFMSSTFWLINNTSGVTGCDKRTTELDIQECVGEITGTAAFAQTFDETIHSNTHSRNTTCAETPTGSEGNNSSIGAKVWADYHVYGAWWKSPTEVEFYLDGVKVYTITPPADFDLPMQLRLVVETYDWNPVPADGGMTGTEEERTTYYDWVRTWELKDN